MAVFWIARLLRWLWYGLQKDFIRASKASEWPRAPPQDHQDNLMLKPALGLDAQRITKIWTLYEAVLIHKSYTIGPSGTEKHINSREEIAEINIGLGAFLQAYLVPLYLKQKAISYIAVLHLLMVVEPERAPKFEKRGRSVRPLITFVIT